MAKIKMTLKPGKDPQKLFDAGELADTISGKKILLNWDDEFDNGDSGYVCGKIVDDLMLRMKDKSGSTGNMRKRVKQAKVTKSSLSGALAGGKHKVDITVAGIEGRDEGTFPVIVDIDDPAEEPEAANFEDLVKEKKITFLNSTVERLIKADKKNKDKATSIFERGKSYKGHGPTEFLGNANHAHVTNKTALGFKWSGGTLKIVGFGIKSDSAGTGTSGYTWHGYK